MTALPPDPDDRMSLLLVVGTLIAIALSLLSGCGRESEAVPPVAAPASVAAACPPRADAGELRTAWRVERDSCVGPERLFVLPPARVLPGERYAMDPAIWFDSCDRLRVDPEGECRELILCHTTIGWTPHGREYRIARVVSLTIRERTPDWYVQLIEWNGGHCVVEAAP